MDEITEIGTFKVGGEEIPFRLLKKKRVEIFDGAKWVLIKVKQ